MWQRRTVRTFAASYRTSPLPSPAKAAPTDAFIAPPNALNVAFFHHTTHFQS